MTNIELLAKLINQERVANKGTLHDAPVKTERFGKHYSVLIGIGKDHTAEITLTDDALEALDSIIKETSALPPEYQAALDDHEKQLLKNSMKMHSKAIIEEMLKGAEKVDIKGHG